MDVYSREAKFIPWVVVAIVIGCLLLGLGVYGQFTGKDPFGSIARKNEVECRKSDPDGRWRTSEKYLGVAYPCVSQKSEEATVRAAAAAAM